MAKKIPLLAIDDDTEFLELVDYHLDLGGFEVYKASSGLDGLEIARTQDLSVILLDTIMPGMDGLQVLKELKKNKKTKKIPVIMLTARSAISDVDSAFNLGAADYISKPVAIAGLADKIKIKLDKVMKIYS